MRLYVKQQDAPNENPEKEIIRQAQEGSAEAFEELYRRYSKRVYRLCLRMVKNETEAEDLTQEAFLRVFRKIHTFEGKSAFSTWLHRVSVNTVLMSLRKKRLVEVSLENGGAYDEESAAPSQTIGGPDRSLTGLFDRENLVRALRKLPEGYKRMLVLHDALGYEHNEIAVIAGCSAGNSSRSCIRPACACVPCCQNSLSRDFSLRFCCAERRGLWAYRVSRHYQGPPSNRSAPRPAFFSTGHFLSLTRKKYPDRCNPMQISP